jgi:hypothetical protein
MRELTVFISDAVIVDKGLECGAVQQSTWLHQQFSALFGAGISLFRHFLTRLLGGGAE